MKKVAAGRKMPDDSNTGAASAAASITGAVVPVSTFIPACAVTQIEHVWRDVDEFSGWACTACTVPMAKTSAIESRHTTLTNRLRFAKFVMKSRLSGAN